MLLYYYYFVFFLLLAVFTERWIKSFKRQCIMASSSGVFRGGHGAMPRLWPDHENFFCRRLYMKWCVFCRFPANLRKNRRICGFYWTFKSKKWFSFRGLRSPDPHQGLCPWIPLGAPPPDPRYRLALCALAMAPFCRILNTPLASSHPRFGAIQFFSTVAVGVNWL